MCVFQKLFKLYLHAQCLRSDSWLQGWQTHLLVGKFLHTNVAGFYTLLIVTVTGIELTSSLLQSCGSSDISSSSPPSSIDTETFGILKKLG